MTTVVELDIEEEARSILRSVEINPGDPEHDNRLRNLVAKLTGQTGMAGSWAIHRLCLAIKAFEAGDRTLAIQMCDKSIAEAKKAGKSSIDIQVRATHLIAKILQQSAGSGRCLTKKKRKIRAETHDEIIELLKTLLPQVADNGNLHNVIKATIAVSEEQKKTNS